MINKITTAILNWFLAYLLIPISMIVVDYFKMKKTIKQLNIDIEALKNAKTKKDIDIAIDNLP
ncbi:MAG: hypothetical protein RIQ94_185 [Pseudomonadota bacterium]|jgi:hypothetical protein